jgi:glycosyltransferase involved in cell wall biosynthesis
VIAWFWWISGTVVAFAWIGHIVEGAFGMKSVARLDRDEWDLRQANPLSISIIVPARNEAHTIEPALRSLIALDYPNLEVIAVNDRSTDATGEIMERLASESNGRVRVIHIDELPGGWLGKTHAMWKAALESRAEWLLFTDADIKFRTDTLRRVMAYAERDPADHYVLFPTMIFKSFGEKIVMAFFAIMFSFALKPWRAADPNSRDHVGMGAFNLVRRSTYDAIGTYERMRLAVIDDIELGKLVKHGGYRQRCIFGRDLIGVHWATGAFGILHNLTKNIFAQLRFSVLLAALGVAAMLFFNLMPYLGSALAPGWSRLPFALVLGAIVLVYINLHRETREVHWLLVILHPIAALLVAYAVLRSVVVTLKDGGITWRGTKYSLRDLKKGVG